jgi:hypothetical protein
MLTLGPWHFKIIDHIKYVISDPSCVLSEGATYQDGAMDGKPWSNPEVWNAIHNLMPQLPNLSSVMVAFFKGTLPAWERFISEFATGGDIDQATPEEIERACAPPTNDHNEGILGTYRQYSGTKTKTTIETFNAQQMCKRNGTENFMEENFEDEDHKFVMRASRDQEILHIEQNRRAAIMNHHLEKVEKKKQKRQKKTDKATEKAKRLIQVVMVLDKASIESMGGKALDDQLDLYRNAGAPLPKLKKDLKLVAQKKAALNAAIDHFNDGTWKPVLVTASNSIRQPEVEGWESGSEDEQE